MAEFRFSNEHDSGQVGDIMGVLRRPRLWIPTTKDYPDFDNWLMKTETDIGTGKKRAMLAYVGARPVGAVVYQRDETSWNTLNIRNISLTPDGRGRHIGSFMVRNVEIEAAKHDFPGCNEVSVDTKSTNADMINFLFVSGYEISSVEDLYGLGTGLDVVMKKPLAAAA